MKESRAPAPPASGDRSPIFAAVAVFFGAAMVVSLVASGASSTAGVHLPPKQRERLKMQAHAMGNRNGTVRVQGIEFQLVETPQYSSVRCYNHVEMPLTVNGSDFILYPPASICADAATEDSLEYFGKKGTGSRSEYVTAHERCTQWCSQRPECSGCTPLTADNKQAALYAAFESCHVITEAGPEHGRALIRRARREATTFQTDNHDTGKFPRWCEYSNLYADPGATDQANQLLFYAQTEGQKVCGPNKFSAQDGANIIPSVVTQLPERRPSWASPSNHDPMWRKPVWQSTKHSVYAVRDLAVVNFAHFFIEMGMAWAWANAMYASSWDFDSESIATYLAEPWDEKKRQAIDFLDNVDGFPARVLSASASNTVFHRNVKDHTAREPDNGLLLLPKAIVGGIEGMSIWDSNTYTEHRDPGKYDDYYPQMTKTRAYLHYINRYRLRQVDENNRAPMRSDKLYSQINEQNASIIFMNRRAYMRSIANSDDVLAELKAKFGERVYPRVVDFEEYDFDAHLMISLLRKIRVLITPHGANIGNVAFLPAGAGFVEIQPSGHKGHPFMFQELAISNDLEYERVDMHGKHSRWGDGPVRADPRQVISAVERILPRTDADSREQARARIELMLEPYPLLRGKLDPTC